MVVLKRFERLQQNIFVRATMKFAECISVVNGFIAIYQNIRKVSTVGISCLLLIITTEEQKWSLNHCLKIVRIRSYSGPYFLAFGLHTERYSISLLIQSECGKIRTRIIPNTETFYAVLWTTLHSTGRDSATDKLMWHLKVTPKDQVVSSNREVTFPCIMLKKWPNILHKSCGVYTVRFIKYVWPIFNVISGKANCFLFVETETAFVYLLLLFVCITSLPFF